MKATCEHKNKEYADGMYNTAEAPYDAGDFWWTVTCNDCGATLAERDGYSQPQWVRELSN